MVSSILAQNVGTKVQLIRFKKWYHIFGGQCVSGTKMLILSPFDQIHFQETVLKKYLYKYLNIYIYIYIHIYKYIYNMPFITALFKVVKNVQL